MPLVHLKLEDFSNVNVLEKGTFKSKNWLVVRTNVCRKYTYLVLQLLPHGCWV